MSKTIWKIDPAHSEIQFKAKHLMITTVTGKFEKFDATAETDGDTFDNAAISFEAETASINTGTADRDNHLRSDDFFNAEKFPTLQFRSTGMSKNGNGHYELDGHLTIRDVTKPVTLKADFAGIIQDPYGNTKAGFTLEGKIKRNEFNLRWDAVTEAGSIVVSDEIRIACEIQMVKS